MNIVWIILGVVAAVIVLTVLTYDAREGLEDDEL